MSRYGERTRIGEPVSGFGKKPDAGIGYGVATGGSSSSITVDGLAYTLLTFTSDTNLVVTKAGLFDALIIGGGGGGGGGDSAARSGGGGGCGDIVGITNTLTVYLAEGTYAVDIGAGGAGSTRGGFGLNSTINGTMLGAIGGGGAGGYSSPGGDDANKANLAYLRAQGWNGGGNMANFVVLGSDLAVTANLGGTSDSAGGPLNTTACSGGGGGCGAAGGNSVNASSTGGAGGNGIQINTFTGGASYFAGAGGGGGGQTTGGAAGSGGVAGKTTGAGNAGVNYGAGGGGTCGTSGGAGQAGAVFVRFKL